MVNCFFEGIDSLLKRGRLLPTWNLLFSRPRLLKCTLVIGIHIYSSHGLKVTWALLCRGNCGLQTTVGSLIYSPLGVAFTMMLNSATAFVSEQIWAYHVTFKSFVFCFLTQMGLPLYGGKASGRGYSNSFCRLADYGYSRCCLTWAQVCSQPPDRRRSSREDPNRSASVCFWKNRSFPLLPASQGFLF